MDPISDILSGLDFAGILYFTTEFSGDWGVGVPAYRNVIRFHLVLRGACYVRIHSTGCTHPLARGDFFMIPHGAAHDLIARPGIVAPPEETVLRDAGYTGVGPLVIRSADGGEPVRLLCGHFSFAPAARGNAFLAGLPDHIVARNMPGETANWVAATLEVLTAEAERDLPGRGLVIGRVTEVLFVQALRVWMRQAGPATGILRALADPQLARAFGAMHDRPAAAWTVQSLARQAGLSRSAFAERFQRLTGLAPMRYLTEWRMQMAYRMLAGDGRSPDEVALAVGYSSTSAFGRAYAQHFGEGPGQTRRGGRVASGTAAQDDLHRNPDARA